jgi:zinc protease
MNEELDFMGASLNSSSGRDYATLSLKVLKKDLDKGFNLFMGALAQPTFPEEEIRREIEKVLAAIQSAEDQPEGLHLLRDRRSFDAVQAEGPQR